MKRKDYNDDSMKRFDRFNPIYANNIYDDDMAEHGFGGNDDRYDPWDKCYALGYDITNEGSKIENEYTDENRIILENGADEVVKTVVNYIFNVCNSGRSVLTELEKRGTEYYNNNREKYYDFKENVTMKYNNPEAGDAYLYIMKKIYETCEKYFGKD